MKPTYSKYLSVAYIALSLGAFGVLAYRAIPTIDKSSTNYYVSYQFRLDYDSKAGVGFGACQLSQHDGKKLDNIGAIGDATVLIRGMFLPEEYRKNTNTQIVITYIHELRKEED